MIGVYREKNNHNKPSLCSGQMVQITGHSVESAWTVVTEENYSPFKPNDGIITTQLDSLKTRHYQSLAFVFVLRYMNNQVTVPRSWHWKWRVHGSISVSGADSNINWWYVYSFPLHIIWPFIQGGCHLPCHSYGDCVGGGIIPLLPAPTMQGHTWSLAVSSSSPHSTI